MKKNFYQWTVKDKMDYVMKKILPGLRKAFSRGQKEYKGAEHFGSAKHLARSPEEDIRHVARCHVGVRLLDAEDKASVGDYGAALEKIESATGYLAILHARISQKVRDKN